MNWKKTAIDDLESYYSREAALGSLRERVQALNESMDGIKAVSTDKVPVKGGASHMEDSLINNIVERERLKLNYSTVNRLVETTRRGLDTLTDEERRILDGFYMRRTSSYIDDLCEQTGLERAQVYRLKDKALYKYTVATYGVAEL